MTLDFYHANFNFTITNLCNYKCSYCIQGNYQNNTKFLSPKLFRLIIKKIFLEASKSKLKTLDITLMGGELSNIPTTIQYFQIIKEETPNNINICINFLTNFSGEINYFLSLDSIRQSNINVVIDSTLHKDYVISNSFKIKKKILDLLDTSLELKFTFLEKEVQEQYGDYLDTNKIPWTQEEIRSVGYIKETSKKEVRCNALYYNIFPDAKIIDVCRNKTMNFLTFKFEQKEILCRKECPCPFLKIEFQRI